VCIAPQEGEKAISEYFDYFMIFDTIPKIKSVKVFNYAATHGQEVTAKGWLKQFIGYSGDSKLTVGKNVDAISGATVSVAGIVTDIEIKTSLLQSLVNEQQTTD
jgi:Na+-translocating ferredoxin:NAD+ oxidoreductase RnfG subunit